MNEAAFAMKLVLQINELSAKSIAGRENRALSSIFDIQRR
jgi:hypothetical protein